MAEQALAAAIAEANARLIDAFARKDAAAAAACYTEDGKLMAPEAEPYVGRAAIEAVIARGFEAGIAGLDLETATLEGFGDDGSAWEEGRYTLRDASGAVTDVGKYIVIWKKRGGRWLIHRDIMSTNRAPG